MDEQVLACMFKVLSDENRLRILKSLRGGEKCACKLLEELDISQPTLSHHMKILCECGLVIGRREGKWMYYRICCESVRKIRATMQELLAPEQIPVDCVGKEEEKK